MKEKYYDLLKKTHTHTNTYTDGYNIYVQYNHPVKLDEQEVEFMNYFKTVVITGN